MTAPAFAAPAVRSTFGPVGVRHLVIFAFALAAAYLIGPSIFLSACAAVLLWTLAATPAERVLALVLPIAFRAALALGAFHFEPPVQIVEVAVTRVDPLQLLIEGNLWWPRYLVAYPSIIAMDHWGLRFAEAFALYCAAILPASAMALLASVRAWRRLDEGRAFAVAVGFAVLVAVIASQMNGRLIPAHLGMALILLAQARVIASGRLAVREGALLAAGTVLSHMTSGTGLVAFADLVAGGALILALRIDVGRTAATLWILSVVFGPLLFADLVKNLDYYGGGPMAVFTMLDHGPGILLRRQPAIAALAVIGAVAVVIAAWRARRMVAAIPRTLWPAALAIPVTAVGGLYGFSTLSMALPALLILTMCAVLSRTDRREPA